MLQHYSLLAMIRFVKQSFAKWAYARCQHINDLLRISFIVGSRRALFRSLVSGAAFVLFLAAGGPRAAAQVTILHSFGDGSVPHDGGYPEAGLVQAPDGKFYGVAQPVGLGDESVFQITAAGVLKVIHRLASNEHAYFPLLYHNNALIGVLSGSRPREKAGVLFAITGYPNGPWAEEYWHFFGKTPRDGGDPTGSLIASDGDLYGAAFGGGSAGQGAIYKVVPATHKVTVIASFSGSGPYIWPNTGLVRDKNGNFWGSTQGLASGEIYEVTPAGKIETVYLYPSNEFSPLVPLILGSDGNLYGESVQSSSPSEEYVFQLTPSGAYTVVHTFASPGGDLPIGVSGLTEGPNGNLYGLTSGGGTAGKGTVFEVSTDGSSFNVLHNFGDGNVQNDGESPAGALVLGADNNLYGVTSAGGSAGKGTVFRISP
jgi:uncharacterized repeat protein (TIGR03803 family)